MAGKLHLNPHVAKAAVSSKVVMLLLFIHCVLLLSLFVGFCVWSSVCDVVISVLLGVRVYVKSLICGVVLVILYSLETILLGRREQASRL